jgi:lipid intermediate transporter
MKDFRCIECANSTSNIYFDYGKGNIRLAVCSNKKTDGSECRAFVDKYVEFDNVLIFIDMILLKPQAYRHIVFNGTNYNHLGLNDGLIRMGILLILFEVYMKWVQNEAMNKQIDHNIPLYIQYLEMLLTCIVGN